MQWKGHLGASLPDRCLLWGMEFYKIHAVVPKGCPLRLDQCELRQNARWETVCFPVETQHNCGCEVEENNIHINHFYWLLGWSPC